MKRYSNLYGTIYANNSNVAVYASVGASQQLPVFLNEVGAANAQLTVDTVRNVLAGFPNNEVFKAHYAAQPQNDLPVSVRYAPMHLRNHPDMPSTIKPFSAIGISGNENKQDEGDNRYSTYVQTIYIGREHMHEPVTENVHGTQKTYTYLDQIFGTELLDHNKLALVRGNRLRMDYDALPEMVRPAMRMQDRGVVYNAVDAVFDNKTVIVRLEKGCGFNSRAWELLIPIYALMPPRLATEIGFATYLDPAQINSLAADTSIRIFVLPGECELKGVNTSGMLVMDLNEPVRATVSEEMGKILNRWSKMPWGKRQSAMEKTFADTASTFNDKALFIQRSEEFLDQAELWEKGGWCEKGAFATLEELKTKYESLPLCAQIPWMKETFVARVPLMMKEKGAVHKLTGQALAAWRIGKDESAREIYEFGLSMGGTNTRAMADTARDLTEKLMAPQLEAEKQRTAKAIADGQAAIAQLKAESETTLAQVKADADAALAQAKADGEAAVNAAIASGVAAVTAEQEKTVKAIADGEAAVAAEQEKTAKAIADGEAAVAAEKEVTARAIADGEAAVAAEKEVTARAIADGEAAVAAEKEVTAKAIEEGKAAVEQVKKAAAEKIKLEQDAHGVTRKKLEIETAAHAATQQQLDAAKKDCETVKAERDGLDQRLEKAKVAYIDLKKEKDAVVEKLSAVDAKLAEAKAIRSEAEGLREEAARAKAKADKIIHQDNKRMIIIAAAGFMVAVLIFGIIMLVVGLVKGKKEETPVTEPVATVAITEAPTETPTETPTEAPTEEPTEVPTEVPTETSPEETTDATEMPTEVPAETTAEATEAPTEPTETTDAIVVGTVTADNLNVRSEPNAAGEVLERLAVNSSVEILEQQTIDGVEWGRIEGGWINMNSVTISEELSEAETGTAATEGADSGIG